MSSGHTHKERQKNQSSSGLHYLYVSEPHLSCRPPLHGWLAKWPDDGDERVLTAECPALHAYWSAEGNGNRTVGSNMPGPLPCCFTTRHWAQNDLFQMAHVYLWASFPQAFFPLTSTSTTSATDFIITKETCYHYRSHQRKMSVSRKLPSRLNATLQQNAAIHVK